MPLLPKQTKPKSNNPDDYKQWLMSLPPEEREAALDRLLKDYGQGSTAAKAQMLNANNQLDDANTPLKMRQGPSGNPFAISVAPNAMEYVGKGMKQYAGMKNRKASQKRLDELEASSSQAGKDIARAKFFEEQEDPDSIDFESWFNRRR